ncbi:MAG: hypothetical protein H6733_11600 [Alphaproteobacteria bacterium]|nr:hypothetical protein [Alphaproteobacteria bacterium]
MNPNHPGIALAALLALGGCGIQVGGSGCTDERGRAPVDDASAVPDGWAITIQEAFDRLDASTPATGTLSRDGSDAEVTQTVSVSGDAILVDRIPDVGDTTNGCADVVVRTGSLTVTSDLLTLTVDVDITWDAYGAAPPDTTQLVTASTTLSRAEGQRLLPDVTPPQGADGLTVSARSDDGSWTGRVVWSGGSGEDDATVATWTAAP